MKASVIIPSYNRSESLERTIASISLQQLNSGNFEILVIDNDLMGRTREVTDRAIVNSTITIRYFEEPSIGLHNGRHRGAREAHGEILVYVDDDVTVPEGWLNALISSFEESSIAVVGGGVRPIWEDQEPPLFFHQFGEGCWSLLDLGDKRLELNWPICVWGCNMAVRKNVFYEVKGFNPDGIGDKKQQWLRGDGECGFQEKIYAAEYKIIYDPAAYLYHRIPASRLTKQYVYRRMFNQGLSDSYSEIRKDRRKIKIFLRIPKYFYRAISYFAHSFLKRNRRVYLKAYAWSCYAKAMHHIRSLLSSDLYNHILRDNYL